MFQRKLSSNLGKGILVYEHMSKRPEAAWRRRKDLQLEVQLLTEPSGF